MEKKTWLAAERSKFSEVHETIINTINETTIFSDNHDWSYTKWYIYRWWTFYADFKRRTFYKIST